MEKSKSYVALKHPTLFPTNDKFISPARDIAHISHQIIKGSLDACAEDMPHSFEDCVEAARILAEMSNACLKSKDSILDILSKVRKSFNKMRSDSREKIYEHLLMGFLTAHLLGAREATDSETLLHEDMEQAISQGLTLSKLSPELLKQVRRELNIDGEYCRELDRKALKGKVEVPDEQGVN